MILDPLFAAIGEIRREADRHQERIKDFRVAAALAWAAAHAEDAIFKLRDQTFSYADAAVFSIWTHGTIKTKVSAGELINVGTRSDPRLSIEDLVVPLGGILPAAPPHLDSVPDAETSDEACSGENAPFSPAGDATEAVNRLRDAA